jgi:hypothetical protein
MSIILIAKTIKDYLEDTEKFIPYGVSKYPIDSFLTKILTHLKTFKIIPQDCFIYQDEISTLTGLVNIERKYIIIKNDNTDIWPVKSIAFFCSSGTSNSDRSDYAGTYFPTIGFLEDEDIEMYRTHISDTTLHKGVIIKMQFIITMCHFCWIIISTI